MIGRRSDKVVLVTGAGGFIGSHAVLEFVKRGWYVYALTHQHIPDWLDGLERKGNVSLLSGDICSYDSMHEVVVKCMTDANVPLTAIVHCAGRASDVGREVHFRKTNYESIQHLVKICLENEVGKFVFISTTDVYGMRDFSGEGESELAFDDKAKNFYPKYKILAEKWIELHMPKDKYCIVRPAAVWGDDDPTLTKRTVDFLRKSPIILHFGKWKGKNRWPLVHVDYLARAIFAAVSLCQANGQAFNVLESENVSIDGYYRMIAKRYMPEKHFRTIYLPMWVGILCGWIISTMSNILDLKKPFTDPSLYALYSISSNLDFSNAKCEELIKYIEPR